MDNLKDKCLIGYAFSIDTIGNIEGERKVRLQTGKGGAEMCIDECRKEGIPDEVIGEMIMVNTDFGLYSLNDLKVGKNDTDKA